MAGRIVGDLRERARQVVRAAEIVRGRSGCATMLSVPASQNGAAPAIFTRAVLVERDAGVGERVLHASADSVHQSWLPRMAWTPSGAESSASAAPHSRAGTRPELEAAKAGDEIAEQQDDVAAEAVRLLDDGVDAVRPASRARRRGCRRG